MADWNRGHGSVDDMLDAENKRLAENLATKVSRLKSLAYDIDREADDQNEYLDSMVSPSSPRRYRNIELVSDWLAGLKLPECDGPAERQREALLHHGPIGQRQPPHPLLRLRGPGPGLLPAVLLDLQDSALTGKPKISQELVLMWSRDYRLVFDRFKSSLWFSCTVKRLFFT
ncbi:hypothetical protein FQN60_005177 [Etheostoma spectabile]|uniref:t-SNARE coiled-coil homology domain-containing protein n=1 Tax=Etheostoma spectabile TaxID=54343 RepID=A0A5J5DM90_9PERO|nr:hypothetical protein FQN60_005177 [Etheostoma spectabile]